MLKNMEHYVISSIAIASVWATCMSGFEQLYKSPPLLFAIIVGLTVFGIIYLTLRTAGKDIEAAMQGGPE